MPKRRQKMTSSKTGRPTIFNNELADRICSELASGRSARSVCGDENMPSMQTFWRWLREKPDFREQYVHAKAEAADAMVEEIIDIADDGTNDWMEVHDKDGACVGYKLNGEHVQRSKLRVDSRKWIASKLKPKKYGDSVDLNHGVQPNDPIAELIRSIQATTLLPLPQKMIENCLADDNLYDDVMISKIE